MTWIVFSWERVVIMLVEPTSGQSWWVLASILVRPSCASCSFSLVKSRIWFINQKQRYEYTETRVKDLLEWPLCVAKLFLETVPLVFGSCGLVPFTCILSAQSTSHISLSNAFTFFTFFTGNQIFKTCRGILSNLGGWLGFIVARSNYVLVLQVREQGQDWIFFFGGGEAFLAIS